MMLGDPPLQIFEIPATGALLLLNAEMAPVVRALGFQPGVHYVAYTRETLEAVAAAVLDPVNRPAIDAIRTAGQELVRARHTVLTRSAAIDALAEAAVSRLDRRHLHPPS